ncbi:MAG: hypothetical protein WCG98_09975 [bacterium]
MKKALDDLKIDIQETSEGKKDEKTINALEQEIQSDEKAANQQSSTPPPKRIQRKIALYTQQIQSRTARHPERPVEVGEAALSVINVIATSDQDPNIIARTIGRIMKFILKI